jgi:hypothetical protein
VWYAGGASGEADESLRHAGAEMRPLKFLSLCALPALSLTLVLSSGLDVAMAEKPLPVNSPLQPDQEASPDLNDPASDLTDADLERFIDLAFNEKITVPQTQALYESLTAIQKKKVW